MDQLEICTKFFNQLNKENIKYCLWKSNYHMQLGLLGKTDLDLLVREGDKNKLEEIIKIFKFKKIIPTPSNVFPGVEDFLGFDNSTGRLIHLHVHYQLILGQKIVKNYRLPIEEYFLKNIVYKSGFFIPIPEMELLIFIIRSNMKLSILDMIRSIIKNKKIIYPEEVLIEYEYLIRKCDEKKFNSIVNACPILLPMDMILENYKTIREKKFKSIEIIKIRFQLFNVLGKYKRKNIFFCFYKVGVSFIFKIPMVKNLIKKKKKVFFHGGKIFALVGADGSGKSTLTKDLKKWLSWKVSAENFYFGIPKNAIFKFLKKISRLFGALGKIKLGNKYENLTKKLELNLRAIMWVLVARRRFLNYKKSLLLSEEGGIAIADRYPLALFSSMKHPMDGPRIRIENGGKPNKMAHIEENYYSKITHPTKVFLLKIRFDEIIKRKDGTNNENVIEKVCAINNVLGSEEIFIINAEQSYEKVFLDIQTKIWETIQ